MQQSLIGFYFFSSALNYSVVWCDYLTNSICLVLELVPPARRLCFWLGASVYCLQNNSIGYGWIWMKFSENVYNDTKNR